MPRNKKGKRSGSAAAQVAPNLGADLPAEEQIAFLQQKVQSLQELVDAKSSRLQKIRRRDIQVDKLSEKHDEQIDELEKTHNEAFDRLEKRHEREFEKLEDRNEQEIEELESRQERAIEKIIKKYTDIYSDDESESEGEVSDTE